MAQGRCLNVGALKGPPRRILAQARPPRMAQCASPFHHSLPCSGSMVYFACSGGMGWRQYQMLGRAGVSAMTLCYICVTPSPFPESALISSIYAHPPTDTLVRIHTRPPLLTPMYKCLILLSSHSSFQPAVCPEVVTGVQVGLVGGRVLSCQHVNIF